MNVLCLATGAALMLVLIVVAGVAVFLWEDRHRRAGT